MPPDNINAKICDKKGMNIILSFVPSTIFFFLISLVFLLRFIDPSNAQAILQLQYTSGEFSKEFSEYIGKHGLRTPIVAKRNETLRDIVGRFCGPIPTSWIATLSVALNEQAGSLKEQSISFNRIAPLKTKLKEGDEIWLPPCLPVPAYTVAPKMSASLDLPDPKKKGDLLADWTECPDTAMGADVQSNGCGAIIIDIPRFADDFQTKHNTSMAISAPDNSEIATHQAFDFYNVTKLPKSDNTITGKTDVLKLGKIVNSTYNQFVQRNADPKLASIAITRQLLAGGYNRETAFRLGGDLLAQAPAHQQMDTVSRNRLLSDGVMGFSEQWSRFRELSAQFGDLTRQLAADSAIAGGAIPVSYTGNTSAQAGWIYPIHGMQTGDYVLRGEAFSDSGWKATAGAAINNITATSPPDQHGRHIASIIAVRAAKHQIIDIPLTQANAAAASAPPKDLIRDAKSDSAKKPIAALLDAGSPIFDASLGDGGKNFDCGDPPTSRQRFEWNALFSATALRNRQKQLALSSPSSDQTVIRIPDSGFVYHKQARIFHSNHHFSERSLPEALPLQCMNEDDRSHGTSVAGLALGGTGLLNLAQALNLELKFHPRRIYGPAQPSASCNRTNPSHKLVIMPKNINRVLSGIGSGASIVNLSFATGEGSQHLFKNGLKGSPGTLYVAAAGNNLLGTGKANSGIDIQDHEIYPAGLEGDVRTNLIVVAATNWNRSRASFSNFGTQHVDIAYFGCNIPSIVPTESGNYQLKDRSGTSFAAPFVSYVVGVTRALLSPELGLRAPSILKARLLASADLESDLVGDIADGRFLNPIKAVALYEDVVTIKERFRADGSATTSKANPFDRGRKLLFGQIVTERDVKIFCKGKSQGNRDLLKVAKHPDDEGKPDSRLILYFLTQATADTAKRKLVRTICAADKAKNPTIQFKEHSDNDLRPISLDQIKDITFAMPKN